MRGTFQKNNENSRKFYLSFCKVFFTFAVKIRTQLFSNHKTHNYEKQKFYRPDWKNQGVLKELAAALPFQNRRSGNAYGGIDWLGCDNLYQ